MNAERLQRYLNMLDEGKGTAYERYALNIFLEQLVDRLKFKKVCEVPANGVMGVPGIKSLVLAMCGCEVTLVNPSPKAIEEMKKIWQSLKLEANFVVADYHQTGLPENAFDFVWNFCVFEHFEDPQAVIAEMARLSNRYVFMEIQNVHNIGLPLHRLYHWLRREPWDHGDMTKMKYTEVVKFYKACGLDIFEIDCTDMPPWPDINMKISGGNEPIDYTEYGDEFANLRPSVTPKPADKVAADWRRVYGNPPPFEWWMYLLKWWFYTIEKFSPRWFRMFYGHHPYVIGLKKNTSHRMDQQPPEKWPK
ncbi:MAG: class I SAM-dependent methyltransferase [Gemmatimonadetes bacterium]|nr:MAG: class I SAM-dependent methyltransferase [Gemmatimonadota bacterium]